MRDDIRNEPNLILYRHHQWAHYEVHAGGLWQGSLARLRPRVVNKPRAGNTGCAVRSVRFVRGLCKVLNWLVQSVDLAVPCIIGGTAMRAIAAVECRALLGDAMRLVPGIVAKSVTSSEFSLHDGADDG